MGLPHKGFPQLEVLVFPLLSAPNIQMSWARSTSKLNEELAKSVGEMLW